MSEPMTKTCGCGHLVSDHELNGRCTQWWRYPDVLEPRQCGCIGVWTPAAEPATRPDGR